jgi:hypothetical protein
MVICPSLNVLTIASAELAAPVELEPTPGNTNAIRTFESNQNKINKAI